MTDPLVTATPPLPGMDASQADPGATDGSRSGRAAGTSGPLDFEQVYSDHLDAVSHCLLALGVPRASVDDAVQDTFLVVYRRLGEFEGRSSVRTWVLSIAVRVAADHRRRHQRKGRPQAELSDELPARDPLPDDLLERSEAIDALLRLLTQLDEAKRTVFVLAELEQLTAPEIAAALDVPVNTVYSRLRLARQEFEAVRVAATREGPRR